VNEKVVRGDKHVRTQVVQGSASSIDCERAQQVQSEGVLGADPVESNAATLPRAMGGGPERSGDARPAREQASDYRSRQEHQSDRLAGFPRC
jgi:hypothetical protein